MTTTTDAATTTGRTSEPVGGGLNRLQAFDGLFLRAEHLQQIQTYAEQLAYATGQATGHGVVHGFDVPKIDKDAILRVGPGLAVNPQGRPLKSEQIATIALTGLTPAADGYWIVEIIAASTPYGDESVYGQLCTDPCAGGSTQQPFSTEGIRVRLTPATEPQLDNLFNPAQRRNFLASRLFAKEHTAGPPWLTTPPLTSHDWNLGAPPPTGDSVPIAVLLRTAGEWEIDVWAVRREIGAPTPQHTWQTRLGMRPWPAFLAQILQFQDLLATKHAPPTAANTQRHIEQQLAYAIAKVKERKQKEPLHVLNMLRSTLAGTTTETTEPLPGLGITELPPAGYLPTSGSDSVEDQITALLGPHVDTRFCRCRPDHVPHAIEQAQHMDRIPLTDQAHPPAIDILVPIPGTGPITDATTAYGWVAFTRRRSTDCGPGPVDEVDVYATTDDSTVIEKLDAGHVPDGEPLATATFPPRTWAVPTSDAYQKAVAAVGEHNKIALYGLASSEERRPLAAVRAALLLGPLDDKDIDSFVLRTAVVPAGTREAIVIAVGDAQVAPTKPEDPPEPGEEQ
ncbi:hypothetical protein [Actinoplanes solisilvae]|uniref:hypothetical protein n=1 Tax=Actinoplanes solisilvae TaxID=2486853 RepID=UPI000FDB25D2|nr:hypothetical protein [Actinoplanes solisilvae]